MKRLRETCRLGVPLLLAIPVLALAQEAPHATEAPVEAALDPGVDRDIEDRLRGTFDAIEALEGIDVEAHAGVVRLTGQVDDARSLELAGELARNVQGVSAVDNAIHPTRSVERRLRVALDRLVERAWGLLGSLPLLVLALSVCVGFVLLSRVLVAWEAPFRRISPNVFVRDLAKQAARVAVVLFGLLLALEILDATALVGAVLGAAGVVGLAVGFAFRDLVENYIASILLSLRQPFAPRDLVKIGDHLGHVARLTSRATLLVTLEGNHVRVPNGVVFKATIENFTRKPERRFDVGVGVGVDDDLAAAQDLAVSVLEGMDGVLSEPPPFAWIEELGDSNVLLRFFGWVDQRRADFGKVRSEAVRLVKQAFDREGIEMPEPIQRVRLEHLGASEPSDASHAEETGPEGTRDVSPDRHLQHLVEEERSGATEDLLSDTAHRE